MDSFDIMAFLSRTKDFGLRTFGPGTRTKGVCDHIRKELKEIKARPDDVMEWVDVATLAIAGAWRSGAQLSIIAGAIGYLIAMPQETIVAQIREAVDAWEVGSDPEAWVDILNLALLGIEGLGYPREAAFHLMLAKQIKNEARKWPDWRAFSESDVIEHVRL